MGDIKHHYMSNHLALIPIHLDVLHLEQAEPAAEERIDFSRLPYFDGKEDIGEEVAYLGDELQSIPFRDDPGGLQPGIHLHWSLPRALTKSTPADLVFLPDFLRASPEYGVKIWNQLSAEDGFYKNWIKPIGPAPAEAASVTVNTEEVHRTLKSLLGQESPDTETVALEKILRTVLLPKAAHMPPIPNRWLIRRYTKYDEAAKELNAAWVLESDVMPMEEVYGGYTKELDPNNSTSFPRPNPTKTGDAPLYVEVGHVRFLGAWLSNQASEKRAALPTPLTALGYGDPTFAAYYQNCKGVLGFYDNLSDQGGNAPLDPNGFTYEILGFYFDPQWDYVNLFLQHLCNQLELRPDLGASTKKTLDYVNRAIALTLEMKVDFPFTEQEIEQAPNKASFLQDRLSSVRSMYYGRVKYVKEEPTGTLPIPDLNVSIGYTGSEAASVHFANTLGTTPEIQVKMEEFLESLQLSPQLEGMDTDTTARFHELRHQKGFRPEKGGWRWAIRKDQPDDSPVQDPEANLEVKLPDELVPLLHLLNQEQQASDRLTWQITSLKQQLYADWNKYMISQYPPDTFEASYPDVDAIKHLMEQTGIEPLKRLQEALFQSTNNIQKRQVTLRTALRTMARLKAQDILDWDALLSDLRKNRKLSPLLPEPNETPLKEEKKTAILNLLHSLADTHQKLTLPKKWKTKEIRWVEKMNPKEWATGDFDYYNRLVCQQLSKQIKPAIHFRLSKVSNAPFWGPNDPVINFTSDGLAPDHRYTRRNAQPINTLTPSTLWTSGQGQNNQLLPIKIQEDTSNGYRELFDKLSTTVKQLLADTWRGIHFVGQEQLGKNSYPLLMDWMVEYFPIKDKANKADTPGYPKDYLTANYRLPPNEPNFLSADTQPSEGGHTYTGSTILTPQGGEQLDVSLERFLTKEYQRLLKSPTGSTNPDEVFSQYLLSGEDEMLTAFYAYAKSKKNILPPDCPLFADNLNDVHFDEVQSWLGSPQEGTETLNRKNFLTQLLEYLEGEGKTHALADSLHLILAQLVYDEQRGIRGLSQSIGGFHDALMMRRIGFQLNIDDPLGFAPYRSFAKEVAQMIGTFNHASVLPHNDFFPLRAGFLKLVDFRIIDTFGQTIFRKKQLQNTAIATADPMRSTVGHQVELKPRFSQPSRLNFRWLSALDEEVEANDHPSSTPVCGWIVVNELDRSILVFSSFGESLGYIDEKGRWRVFPGHIGPVIPQGIEQPELRKWVLWVGEQAKAGRSPLPNKSFMDYLIERINTALDNIATQHDEHHQGVALLTSQPLALVRAGVQLELKGMPVVHQGWEELKQEVKTLRQGGPVQRVTYNIEEVDVPLRLGEHHKLGDGLVMFWESTNDNVGYLNDRFYTPLDDQDLLLRAHGSDTINDAPVKKITMLMEPTGVVHATTGILPVQQLQITPDFYKDIINKLEVIFLSTPLLTRRGQIQLSLPTEPDYTWSWIENNSGKWREVTIDGHLSIAELEDAFPGNGEAIWSKLVAHQFVKQLEDGSGRLRLQNAQVAGLPGATAGKSTLREQLKAVFGDLAPKIAAFLAGHQIRPFVDSGAFHGPQEIREGWLKLRPVDQPKTTV